MANEWTPPDTGVCDQCDESPLSGTMLRHYRWGSHVAGENPDVIHHQWVCESCSEDLDHLVRRRMADYVRVPASVIGSWGD